MTLASGRGHPLAGFRGCDRILWLAALPVPGLCMRLDEFVSHSFRLDSYLVRKLRLKWGMQRMQGALLGCVMRTCGLGCTRGRD